MELRALLLVASAFSILSFLLDLKAGENRSETLKDLFIGITLLAWYMDRPLIGSLFAISAAAVYYPEIKKIWIRRKYGWAFSGLPSC
ncbi:hypothetical protein E3E36_09090 [Thermococcus sp. M36]|uniref:hypothetical protein n=1 Tax=Thermococcus sp. M36 TaxID=1638261 RepID=UPI001439D00D|nr:hypothetical protein [Thermococcus sp. M36]NJE06294.1 hypothetical protein [Thermococcus sp. M36]